MLRKLTAAVFAATLIAVPAFAAETPSQASSPAMHQAEKSTQKQTKVSHPVRPGRHVRHAKHLHRAKQHIASANKVAPSKHAQVHPKPVTSSGTN
jgi:hypothetical protein